MAGPVPYVPQRADHDCAPACLRMVYAAHGVPYPAALDRLATPAAGTPPARVAAALRARFARVTTGRMTLADLWRAVARRLPAVALVSLRSPGDHWVVVTGVRGGRVLYMDPARGPQSKPWADWLRFWAGPTHALTTYAIVPEVPWPSPPPART